MGSPASVVEAPESRSPAASAGTAASPGEAASRPASATGRTQAPPLQVSPFEPQPAPSGSDTPLAQTGLPVEQSRPPFWHGLPGGVQGAPAAQAVHTAPLQTWSTPHDVPLAASESPVQSGAPLVHDTFPIRQGLAGSTQASP